MFIRLLILFTVVPLIELWLLFEISNVTSPTFTVGVVLATGFAGAALARRQGWQTWGQIQQQLASGQVPTSALLDGLMILIAGAVLITPGVITDVAGFLLLIPPVRNVVKKIVAARFRSHSGIQFQSFDAAGPKQADAEVIDVEFTRSTNKE